MHRSRVGVVVFLIALWVVRQLWVSSGLPRALAKAFGSGSAGDRPGALVLTQATYFLIVACLTGAITVAAAVGLAFAKTSSALLAIVGLVLSFGGFTLLLGKESRLRIEIDTEGVRAERPWRGPVRFGWAEVDAVLFSRLWYGLVVRAGEKREIIVPLMVVGTGSLIDALHAHVAPAIWTSALAEYDRARSRAG